MRKAGGRSKSDAGSKSRSKTDDGGVIVIPNKMKESHASPKKRRRMDGGAFGEISLHSGSFVTAPAFDPSMMPSGSTSVSAVNSISARAY